MSVDGEPPSYAIRLHRRARLDVDDILYGLSDGAGLTFADAWQEGLVDALAGLATFPRRCPIAREDRLFQREVRQLIYRLPRSRTSHRILFTIYEPPDDAPFVFILHIRHGARGPMIADEADALQAE